MNRQMPKRKKENKEKRRGEVGWRIPTQTSRVHTM